MVGKNIINFITVFIFIFIQVTYLPISVKAADIPEPTITGFQLPGPSSLNADNCGYGDIPGYERCCLYQKCEPFQFPGWMKGAGIVTALLCGVTLNTICLGALGVAGGTVTIMEKISASTCGVVNSNLDQTTPCIRGIPEPTDYLSVSDPYLCKCVMPNVVAVIPLDYMIEKCEKTYTNENILGQRGVPADDPIRTQQALNDCKSCAAEGGYYSGLGCIPLKVEDFTKKYLIKYSIGLGGLFALICIIISAIRFQTSRGIPDKLNKARENLTACIVGLILIISAIFILRLIGINILSLPGLQL